MTAPYVFALAAVLLVVVAAVLAWHWATRRTGRHHPIDPRQHKRRIARAWPPDEKGPRR